jgi:hypothetical protein
MYEPAKLGQTVRVSVPTRWSSALLVNPAPERKAVQLTDHIGMALDAKAFDSCRSADEAIERVVKPAVEKLAAEVRRRKMDVFGQQAIPTTTEAATVSSSKSGLSLRGLKFYDAAPGEPPKGTLYLDILGGSSGLKDTD